MTDTKFTPGPLTVKKAGAMVPLHKTCDCAIVTENKFIVAECYSNIRRHDEFSADEAMANANLYAASPDLYAAGQAIIDGYFNRIDGMERLARCLEDKTIRYARVRIEEVVK